MAKQIPLRRRDGTVRAYALVDDADFEELSRWRWHLHTNGYVRRCTYLRGGGYERVYLHAQLLGRGGVDHIDGNRLDCRRSNLRLAGKVGNGENRPRLNKNNTSGVRGVSWKRGRGKWVAHACPNGRTVYLGLFDRLEDAAAAASAYRASHMPFSEDARRAA